MVAWMRHGGSRAVTSLVWALALGNAAIPWALADGGAAAAGPVPNVVPPVLSYQTSGYGTLGYGPPGAYPGFQGFGLGYHPGYGYGGAGLGVGADGGYPFYGGPGYPHPWPQLRRFGSINPFPYYGGPGSPSPACPNYFGPVGPLAAEQPVITVERDPRDPGYGGDYGGFTGTIPYPETTFAPFVTIAAAGGSSSGVSSSSAPNAPPNPALGPGEIPDIPGAGHALGIKVVPLAERGARGIRITEVRPASVAEDAGLHVGDVIRQINGHLTEQPGHLVWIMANAAPGNVLNMTVLSAADGKVRTVKVSLP